MNEIISRLLVVSGIHITKRCLFPEVGIVTYFFGLLVQVNLQQLFQKLMSQLYGIWIGIQLVIYWFLPATIMQPNSGHAIDLETKLQ